MWVPPVRLRNPGLGFNLIFFSAFSATSVLRKPSTSTPLPPIATVTLLHGSRATEQGPRSFAPLTSSSQTIYNSLDNSTIVYYHYLWLWVASPHPVPVLVLASPLPTAASPQESASISFPDTYASFVFILLRTLLHCRFLYPHSFQAIPHSLQKTPRGVGFHGGTDRGDG